MACIPTLRCGTVVFNFFPASKASCQRRAKYSCSVPAVFAQKIEILSTSDAVISCRSRVRSKVMGTGDEGDSGSTKSISCVAERGCAWPSSCKNRFTFASVPACSAFSTHFSTKSSRTILQLLRILTGMPMNHWSAGESTNSFELKISSLPRSLFRIATISSMILSQSLAFWFSPVNAMMRDIL